MYCRFSPAGQAFPELHELVLADALLKNGELGHLPAQRQQAFLDVQGQCQTKTTGFTNVATRPASASKLTPLGEGGGAIELEIFAAIKVALLVEVVVN